MLGPDEYFYSMGRLWIQMMLAGNTMILLQIQTASSRRLTSPILPTNPVVKLFEVPKGAQTYE